MGLGMFTAQQSPIAIDFGSSSVKLMQLDMLDSPSVIAAARLEIPESFRSSSAQVMQYLSGQLPTIIRNSGFKGKKIVTAIPSYQTYLQHLQVVETDGVSLDEIVSGQLQMQMNCSPNSLVVRNIPVPGAQCRDQTRKEVICFAAPREIVMRYVKLLKKCKLDVLSMHTESFSTIWAFQHLNRRKEYEDNATLYINLAWSGTTVTIAHGSDLVFARHINVGGQHFDHQIAKVLKCDLAEAIQCRKEFQIPIMRSEHAETAETASGEASATRRIGDSDDDSAASLSEDQDHVATMTSYDRRSGEVPGEFVSFVTNGSSEEEIRKYDFEELLDTITDEISMCLRYHKGLFPDQEITRTVFIGGESTQSWLSGHIRNQLGMNAYIGDPIARFADRGATHIPNISMDEPQPGWTIVCGLCTAPSDQ